MTETIDTVLIFAAGFGTRMLPLTATKPKPLILVNGKALLDHSIDLAINGHVNHIFINTHYLSKQIEKHLETYKNVQIKFESPHILDTGGGLKAISPNLKKSPIFTSNVDCIWKGCNPFKILHQHWSAEKMDALLLLIPIKKSVGYSGRGDFKINDAGLVGRDTESGLVYSGIQIIKHEICLDNKKKIFSLNEIWDTLIKKEKLYGVLYNGVWADVGTSENIKLAEDIINTKL